MVTAALSGHELYCLLVPADPALMQEAQRQLYVLWGLASQCWASVGIVFGSLEQVPCMD